MVVKHIGVISKIHNLPGGGPQGTNLGILSYLVNINSCGVPLESIENIIHTSIRGVENIHPILPLPPPRSGGEPGGNLSACSSHVIISKFSGPLA